jgi:hypothetical protein
MQVAQYCGRRLIEMKSRQPETQRIMEESRSLGPVMQYQKASDKRQFLLLPEFVPDARPFALTAHCNQPSALDV